MPHLHVNGTPVHYRETGSGAPVALLHGGASSGAQWHKVIPLLADAYRMITVDHYGFGETGPWPGPPEQRSHEEEAVLVRAVLAHLCPGEPAHLVGHSYGGGVALRLVVETPALAASMVLVDPMAMSVLKEAGEEALHAEMAATARRFIAYARAGKAERAWQVFYDASNGEGAWQVVPEETRRRMLAETESGVSGYLANLAHVTTEAECRALALPTTLLYGAESEPCFRRMSELIAGAIPGARLETVAGAGHMSMVTHPEAVAERLLGHLEGVD